MLYMHVYREEKHILFMHFFFIRVAVFYVKS